MKRKLWLRILISLVGAAALAALIWFAAPLIAVEDAHPLEERSRARSRSRWRWR